MAPAPLFWQQLSSLSWGSKLQPGSAPQPPSTAAQLINTNLPSLIVTMKAAGWMVEVWSCAPFCHHWNRGCNLQWKHRADIQRQWPLTLSQWVPAEATWGSSEGSLLSPWRMECRQLLYHQYSAYLTTCWFPHINRPLAALQGLLAPKIFVSQL